MTLINPQQALEELMGDPFIEWLQNYVASEMQSWPIIQKFSEIQAKPEKIKKIMLQVYQAHEAYFGKEGDPGFLRFAIANLSESDDPTAESALEILEKRRTDELGGHNTHKHEQWLRFLKALEVSSEEISANEPKEVTRTFIAELSDVYSTFEWQTAVSAMAAHDWANNQQYTALRKLIQNNFTLNEKDLEVLSGPEINNHHLLDKIVFDGEAKELVWLGVTKQLEIRKEFLAGLEKYL